MAQLALAAAGAVVGSFFGAPQLGFAVGAALGGSLFPEKVKGPRLEDLKSNQYEYGTPVPHLYGHARVPGVVVWSSDKQEVSQTSGGKGGPEVTSYTYKQDVLYVLSANECAGVRKIWSNGKLIWSNDADATDATRAASADTDAWEDIEFFTGAEDQLPWSVYEAAVGVGLAPAMRGRFSVGITGLNLGSSGFPPNLTFELVHRGEPGDALTVLQSYFDDNDRSDISFYENGQGVLSGSAGIVNERFMLLTQGGAGSGTLIYTGESLAAEGGPITIEFFADFVMSDNLSDIDIIRYVPDSIGDETYRVAYTGNAGAIKFDTQTSIGVDYSSYPTAYPSVHVALVLGETSTRLYLNGDKVYEAAIAPPSTADGSTGTVILGSQAVLSNTVYEVSEFRVVKSEVYTGDGLVVPSPHLPPPDGGTITAEADPLDEVLEDLCVRSGLDLSYVDASACSALLVDSLAVSQVTPARQVIETLMAAKNVTVVEGDQLKFVLRGGAAITGPTYDELGATEGDPEGERLPITIRSDIEIPAQVAVTYANLLDDYQAGTEYSDRLIGGARGVTTVQLPLGLNPQEAKRIADVRLHDGALAATSIGPVGLTSEWSHLEPTDVIPLVDQSGSTFRTRIEKITDGGGVRTLEVVLDDASIITSVALTDVTDNSSTVVRRVDDTQLELMDIPIMRDADNDAGIYAAVGKTNNEYSWPGAALYRGVNDTSFTEVARYTDRTFVGVTTSTLGAWTGGWLFDEVNSVTVAGAGTLSSYTEDAILNGTASAYLIGDEIIYAKNATLVSTGVYTLSGLLRGRKGTDWAAEDAKSAGTRVVLIQTTGIRRIGFESGQLGTEFDFRAVTFGRSVGSVDSESITPMGVGLKPWAPVHLEADDNGDGTFDVTWQRRTRLSCRFGGSLGINTPLGEASESYAVEVYDGASVTSTQTVTEEAATVTASAGDVVRVYQVSAIVGRGYVAEITL